MEMSVSNLLPIVFSVLSCVLTFYISVIRSNVIINSKIETITKDLTSNSVLVKENEKMLKDLNVKITLIDTNLANNISTVNTHLELYRQDYKELYTLLNKLNVTIANLDATVNSVKGEIAREFNKHS